MEQCYYIVAPDISQRVCSVFAQQPKMERDNLGRYAGIYMVILLKKSCRRDILNESDIVNMDQILER